MAAWKKLRYGSALVAVGLSITAVTVYVTGRWRMKAVDDLELMQATIERCMAVGTNNVALPSYVKTFTEYIYTNTVITNLGYDTTNTIIYTNAVTISNVIDGTVETFYQITTNDVVLTGTNFATNTVTFVITTSYSLTNALGWRFNTNYLSVIDVKIKELAPYFVDTNTIYDADGVTNFSMHTFTGLLATLSIGDGTNFTAYSWRTKTNALRERHRILYVYQQTLAQNVDGTVRQKLASAFTNDTSSAGWELIKTEAESLYSAASVTETNSYIFGKHTSSTWDGSDLLGAWIYNRSIQYGYTGAYDQISRSAVVFVRPTQVEGQSASGYRDNGTGFLIGEWYNLGSISGTTNASAYLATVLGEDLDVLPVWGPKTPRQDSSIAVGISIGHRPPDIHIFLDWFNGFQYATNVLN